MDLTKRRPLHENKNFRLTKICERTEEIILSLAFVCFRFTEICFLNFPSNENVRKQHLSANAYSRENMKFSYTIIVRKNEILHFNKSKYFLAGVQVNFLLTIFKWKDEIFYGVCSENWRLVNFSLNIFVLSL